MTLAYWAARQPDVPAVISDHGDSHLRRAQRQRQPARPRPARRGAARRRRALRSWCRTGPSSPRSLAADQPRRCCGSRRSTGTSPATRPATSSTTARPRRSSPTHALRDRGRRRGRAHGRARRCASPSAATDRRLRGRTTTRSRPRTAPTSTTPSLGSSMLYTSGTTGRPKGVHRPRGTAPRRPPQPSSTSSATSPARRVHLCTGPLYHAAPLAFSLAGPLTVGVGVRAHGRLGRRGDARASSPSTASPTPTWCRRCSTACCRCPTTSARRHDVSSLRFVLHGAAPCPVPVKQAHHRLVGPGPARVLRRHRRRRHVRRPSDAWLTKPGTVGKPAAADHIRILDDEGDRAARRRDRHRLPEGAGHGPLRLLQGRRQDRRAATGATTSRSATSATSTTTASCSSPTAARTSSSRAA